MMRSKLASGNGSRSASPLTSPPAHLVVGDLAGFEHPADHGAHVLELAGVVVERDDGRAPTHGGERVPTPAAAHVEEPVALAQVEAVEVDGQHGQLAPFRSPPW